MVAKSGDKAESKGGFVELVKTIVYALLLAGVIRTLFFQPFWIPSGSMKPTLLIGDFLFVNKMAYGYSRHSCPFSLCPFDGRILARDPERGDVVVFKHPTNGTDYIKRLIGLPGDRVRMVDGVLYINGEALPQEPDGTFVEVNAPQGPMRSMPRCMNRPVRRGRRVPGRAGGRDAAERAPAPDPRHRGRVRRHDAGVRGARGRVLLHGRQPRQLDGLAVPAVGGRRRLRAVREPDRARRPGDVLLGRAVDARLLDLAARPLLQGIE